LAGTGCNALHIPSLVKHRTRGDNESAIEYPPSEPGAPQAYSFRMAPYIFLADFEIPKTQPVFKELANLRDQVYKELLLPSGTASVQVHLFENREKYERFMHERYPTFPNRRAFFVAQERSAGGPEDLLVYTFWEDARIRQDLRHELTHGLLHCVIRDVPLWLDEGLAEYFELPPEKNGISAIHLEHLRSQYAAGEMPNLDKLERLTEVSQMKMPQYRESWAWVHMMLRSNPEAKKVLLTYLQHLRNQRDPGSLRRMLTKVYPNPEEALRQHVARLAAMQTGSKSVPH
jgi:hypothetical protein